MGKYFKSYKMHGLKSKDVVNVQNGIKAMGFSTDDYTVVHFNSTAELKIKNSELHWLIKSFSKLERN